MTAEDLAAHLPGLGVQGRAKIRAALDALDSLGEGDDEPAALLWQHLTELGPESNVQLPPFAAVRRMKDYKNFRKTAASALEYVDRRVRPENRTEQRHAARIAARALLSRLCELRKDLGLQVTPRVVMQQTANVPEAVEACWPGYGAHLRILLEGKG